MAERSPGIFIKQMELGPMQNFVYLIGCPATRIAAVVDPAWEADVIVREAEREGYRIEHILVTHHHYDHVNGVEPLLNRLAARVHVNKNDVPYLKSVAGDIHKAEGGDKIQVGEVEIALLHTPGHTPGSQCFRVKNSIVSGDTLFIGNCGRTDLPGGDDEEMFRTMEKLRQLPDETILLPGHNYADRPTSTIADEKKGNSYLMCATMSEFLRLT